MRDTPARPLTRRSLRPAWTARLRLTVLFGAALVLLASCGTPSAPDTTSGDDELRLVVHAAGDANDPTDLDGAVLRGRVTVKVTGSTSPAAVEYRLEGLDPIAVPSLTVSSTPYEATLDTTLLADGRHTLTATATRADGTTRELHAAFEIANLVCDVPPGLVVGSSDGWQSSDVGDTALRGSSAFCADERPLVVQASGTDVWNERDGFHFVYQALEGDGSLTVRVDDLEAAHEWTKAGVMVREVLTPDARNAFVHLTDFNGVLMQRRDDAGGSTSDVLPDGTYMRDYDATAPWWLRIERRGDTLIGSHAPDGEDWTELGRVTLPLGDAVYIGMAVTSRNEQAVARASFSDVRLERSDGGDGGNGGDGGDGGGDAPPPEQDGPTVLPPSPISGPTVTSTFRRSSADFANPERGFHGDGGEPGDYAREAGEGHTLVRRYVRLDDYRYREIPQSFLDELDSDLAALREHGLKVILRFAYNFGFDPDAPLDRVLQHIDQVAPILQEHSDVIAVLQAGFIGAWGEWHGSTHDLLDFDARRAVTDALLDALPPSRMIQIRYPYRASDLFPTPPDSGSAFDGSDASRIGQVNDCFVSTGSDGGTFTSDDDYAYMEDVTRWTVMGGETCQIGGLSSRNDGDNAAALLERFHWDYLNRDFYTPVIDKWIDQGYYDEISRRLGYRYVLRTAIAEASGQPGGTLSIELDVENEGYGKLYNPRPIELVLRHTATGEAVALLANEDARTVLPGPGQLRTVPLTVALPSDLPSGSYDLHLALPDASSRLADDPRYAVRLANETTWNASTGENDLDLTIDVE
jgi:hypothetical protein